MAAEVRDDAVHRSTFPDRKCAVGVGCVGRVLVYGPAMLCESHALKWEDADQGAKVERMRAWVRAERGGGRAGPA